MEVVNWAEIHILHSSSIWLPNFIWICWLKSFPENRPWNRCGLIPFIDHRFLRVKIQQTLIELKYDCKLNFNIKSRLFSFGKNTYLFDDNYRTICRVHAGSLAFSVTMFLIGSTICIFLLQYRRYEIFFIQIINFNSRFNKNVHAELGGPVGCKKISAFIFFGVWVAYLILACLEAYCIIPGF